jgi:phosphomannomutase
MSPNPEDINALTKAFELASEKTADLILANDPDADRLAVAAFDKTGKRYVHLNGNQVGVLFAQYFLEQPQFSSPNSLYVSTIVSSPMLKVMAASYNVLFEEVLPGFKWIANKAMELQEQRGASFVFGYEEAIGYTVGEIVRDKDGISAAALFGELAAHYARHGISVLEKLEALYRRYGLFMSDQHSITIPGLEGASEIAQIMQRLRETPPSTLSGVPVVRWTDYSCQTTYDSDRSQTPCNLPSSNTVSFELAGGSRVTARPSGTEPKIKFYFDICEQIATTEEFASAYERALEALQDLKTDFLKFT